MGIVVSREELVGHRAARAPRAPHDCVRQRLLRSAARRPRPLPAGAAQEADRLIVAVNDDAVAGGKGPGRPILPAADRAELVAALRGVDYVVIFPEPTVDAAAAAAAARRPLQGHRLHRRHRPRARHRPRLWRPRRHRRRSQGSFDARPARPPPRMNFLIVRLGALGDIVHTVPAAAALRRAYPDARIDWVVDARHAAFAELVTAGRSRSSALEKATVNAWVDLVRRLRPVSLRRRARLPGTDEVRGARPRLRRRARRRLLDLAPAREGRAAVLLGGRRRRVHAARDRQEPEPALDRRHLVVRGRVSARARRRHPRSMPCSATPAARRSR